MFNGLVKCTWRADNKTNFTVGKVYRFVNGVAQADECETRYFDSFKTLSNDCKAQYSFEEVNSEQSISKENYGSIQVKRITFNNPATIIHWSDDTKTIVKSTSNDNFDPRIGFLYAFFEKYSGKSKTQCNKFMDSLEDEFIEQMEKLAKKEEKRNK